MSASLTRLFLFEILKLLKSVKGVFLSIVNNVHNVKMSNCFYVTRNNVSITTICLPRHFIQRV